MDDSLIIRTLDQWFHYIQTDRVILVKKNTRQNQEAYLSKLMSFRIVAKGLLDALMIQIDDAIKKGENNLKN